MKVRNFFIKMKVDYKILDAILNDIIIGNSNYKAILLYSKDNSSLNIKFKKIIKTFENNGFGISDISQEILKNNETYLSEQFFSISMFTNRTLFTLKLLEKENNFTKYIENLFVKNIINQKLDNILIITAGDLEASSSLKKYCEKSEYVASIVCYEEDLRCIGIAINNELKNRNFTYTNEVVEYLKNNIGTNNLVISNEIEKIDLYKGSDRKLTIQDVMECVTDSSAIEIGDFCNYFCSFNKTETFRFLNKAFEENIQLVVIIRSLIRYFLQLQRIQFAIDSGGKLEDIIKTERIFWKQQTIIKIHLQKWNLRNINIMLERLIDIEKNTKFSQNGQVLFENFILKSLLYFNK